MKILGIVSVGLLCIGSVCANVVINTWLGTKSSSPSDNNNWTGYQNPFGFAVTGDTNGDTHVGVIDANGSHNLVISLTKQMSHTSLVLNNSATVTQVAKQVNVIGSTLVLNDAATYNATGNTIAWGRDAGPASTLTVNDAANLLAHHLQVGKISQGIVNQKGGSVVLSGDLRLSLDNGTAPASRYNLSAGTVMVGAAFSVGGSDAGLDGGSYFNFTQGSSGRITVKQASYNFAAKINTGKIRFDDMMLNSGDPRWSIDDSVFGQTTLSIHP